MSASIAPQPFNQRKRLLVVQCLSIAAIGLLLFSRPGWDEASTLHEVVEMTGFILILVCIFGRLWSILYVGGRKNSELAISGPYSITRNPLYLFSTIGAFGIGLMFGSIIVAAFLGVCTYAVFLMTARKEEAFLQDKLVRSSKRMWLERRGSGPSRGCIVMSVSTRSPRKRSGALSSMPSIFWRSFRPSKASNISR
jgi:protein-S-isoprenylcysteine O-methyltransferase Ste14